MEERRMVKWIYVPMTCTMSKSLARLAMYVALGPEKFTALRSLLANRIVFMDVMGRLAIPVMSLASMPRFVLVLAPFA